MAPGRVREGAEELAQRVRLRFGPRVLEVRLFGSHARGEGNVGSDVDVYVAVDGLTETERASLFELAGDISIERLLSVQVFAPLPEEREWLQRNECRILRDVQAEGIAL